MVVAAQNPSPDAFSRMVLFPDSHSGYCLGNHLQETEEDSKSDDRFRDVRHQKIEIGMVKGNEGKNDHWIPIGRAD